MDEKKGFFEGGPKMIFVFGLVTGVAITSLLGGSLSLPSFKSGSSDDVVRTFENSDTIDDSADINTAVLAPVTEGEHILGDIENAKVVLVEYSDFECPFCERHHPNLEQLMEDYDGEIAWVFRHFPLTSLHAEAVPAALASECASEQGIFWEYADALFENQDDLGDDLYYQLADDFGLDINEFTECYETGEYEDAVDADQSSGVAAGVTGTPATFINGTEVSGAVPYSTLSDIVDQILGG